PLVSSQESAPRRVDSRRSQHEPAAEEARTSSRSLRNQARNGNRPARFSPTILANHLPRKSHPCPLCRTPPFRPLALLFHIAYVGLRGLRYSLSGSYRIDGGAPA